VVDGVARRYAPWLWGLAALFALRVIAQPLALWLETLPPFEAWHGGALPYPALVALQLVVLAWTIRTAGRFSAGEVVPSRRVGLAALAIGDLYLTTMLLRLALGATVFSDRRWFASPLPTLFHLVLAAYLLVFGWFHFRGGAGAAS
jgi:hypothetical protein